MQDTVEDLGLWSETYTGTALASPTKFWFSLAQGTNVTFVVNFGDGTAKYTSFEDIPRTSGVN